MIIQAPNITLGTGRPTAYSSSLGLGFRDNKGTTYSRPYVFLIYCKYYSQLLLNGGVSNL